MKSDNNSDSEDGDDGHLVIVTSSNVTSQAQPEVHNDDINSLYGDGIIDNLWKSKAMGNYGPEEILVSLWFYISHYFGISSRTDHAKLCLGNINVENEGSVKKMSFNRNFNANNSKTAFNTRFTPKAIYEIPNSKEKCPLSIFETYLSHRPSNFCYPASPLYLQPDKSVNQDYDGPWYAAAGLGKNRIGALFNAALSKSGCPTIRHYNSRRQIIGEVTKSSPPPTNSKLESSQKIKLRICHLSSGNPIVTQSVPNEDVSPTKKSKTKSTCRKKSIDTIKVKKEEEIIMESVEIKQEETIENNEMKTEKMDFSTKKFTSKPPKRMWSLQKSIVNITSKESNPIIRQIMMHLSMSKDPLIASDSKALANRRTENHVLVPKPRSLRSNLKLRQLHLPLWPSIDKFCDSELQRSMKYSFDDDHFSLQENSA